MKTKEMNQKSLKVRDEYLDILRILATIAVVMIHVVARGWLNSNIFTFEWQCYNLFYGILRWAVPVFVMISGALFLKGEEKPLNKLYCKNIAKIVIAFCFWSAIYVAIYFEERGYGFRDTFSNFLKGHYHMWFLFMITGLYMLVPILRKITESEDVTKYSLGLFMTFSVLIPFLMKLFSVKFDGIGRVIGEMLEKVNYLTSLGFVVYFLLGYYLDKREIVKKERKFIWILGIIGFFLTVFLTNWISQLYHVQDERFGEYLNLNVMLESIAVFVLIKSNYKKFNLGEKTKKFVQKFSKYSLGIYLVHAMVLDWVNRIIEGTVIMQNPFLHIPITTIVVVTISYMISAILNKIPVLNKYIV